MTSRTPAFARVTIAQRWVLRAVSFLLFFLAPPLHAQLPREFGVEALALARDSSLVGGALVGAVHPSPRMRVALTVGAGGGEGGFGGRAELAGHFLLSPALVRGIGVYGGGGVAVERRHDTRGFLELLVGLETDPGARNGWVLEAGLGGGVRLAVGWRTRWLTRRR